MKRNQDENKSELQWLQADAFEWGGIKKEKPQNAWKKYSLEAACAGDLAGCETCKDNELFTEFGFLNGWTTIYSLPRSPYTTWC